AVILARMFAGQQHRTGAVGHLRGIAGGHAAVALEHGPEFRQHFGVGVAARAFVVLDHAAVFLHAARTQIGIAIIEGVGRDLFLEVAGVLRRERALVAAQREGILFLARNLPLSGDVLGGDAHAVGNADVVVLEN